MRFNDFDQFASLISEGKVEHYQLSKGSFNGVLQILVSEHMIISSHHMNQVIVQHGESTAGFVTFLLSGDMNQDFIWRKNRLKGNVVGILHDGMEHYSVLQNSFYGLPVSINKKYLYAMVEQMRCESFIDLVENNESVELEKYDAMRIQNLVSKLFLVKNINEFSMNEIAKEIIYALLRASSSEQRDVGSSRRKIFKTGLNHMLRNSYNPIKISELCNEIGVSERNLRYAFRDASGLSPKQFVDRLRLNLVRNELKSGKFSKVVDVSGAFGYWHTGKFASDYYKLFSEYPSTSMNSTQVAY